MEPDSQRMKRQFCCASEEDFVSDKPMIMTAISPPKSTGLADPAALQKEALSSSSLSHLFSMAAETCTFPDSLVLSQRAEEQNRAGGAGNACL